MLGFIKNRKAQPAVAEKLGQSGIKVILTNRTGNNDGVLLAQAMRGSGARVFFPVAKPNPRLQKFGEQYLTSDYNTTPTAKNLVEAVKKSENVILIMFADRRATPLGRVTMMDDAVTAVIKELGSGVPIFAAAMVTVDGSSKAYLAPPITVAQKVLDGPKEVLGDHLLRTMEDQLCRALIKRDRNLLGFLVNTGREHGSSKAIFMQLPNQTLTYRTLYRAAWAFGNLLKKHQQGERVGVLLPTSLGAGVLFYAAAMRGFVPVFLNPSSGPDQILSACKTATLKTVYTAKALLDQAPTAATAVKKMRENGLEVIILEELRKKIGLGVKLKALAAAMAPRLSMRFCPGYRTAPNAPAVVLFTSGSEGQPKGVALSHANLIANCNQVRTRLAVPPQIVMLNSLPVFHTLGMLAGIVFPLSVGLTTIQYPSPLHYTEIPKIIHDYNVAIMFSTSTFLSNYAKHAGPHDFQDLHLVIAGGEKLQDSVRKEWHEKFDTTVLEGYGVTETSPVISANIKTFNRVGTVGRLFPLMEAKVVKTEGIKKGGVLHVRGPNIMLGYYFADRPGELNPPQDGWHNTGDIVELDELQYIKIVGRAKRFVKIAGEMVPLDRIEECLNSAWPDGEFATTAIAGSSRGEDIGLLTTLPSSQVNRTTVGEAISKAGLPPLYAPRTIVQTDEFPLLPTGKADYQSVAKHFQKGA